MNKKWTKKEEELLRKLAPSQSDVEIGKQLGRSNDSVRNKRKRMGLSQPELSIEDFIERDILKEEKQLSDKKVKHLLKENKFLKRERDALLKVKGVKTYKISQKKVPNECNAVTVTSTSDIHYEEPVKLSQVNGLNEYNTTIAKQRIEKLFKMTAKLIEVHKREYIIKTHILALLGDFISGSIHDDLMEANEMQPTDAIWEVQNLIASGIEYLLANTDVDLLIPCSAGNHSRITAKQRVATEFGNSLEILIYRNLQLYFANNKRVTFIISDSYHTYVEVLGFTCRFHHGHAIRYAGGVGGITIPVNKAINEWNKSKRADFDFFGHFHQLFWGGNFVCNGSVIGYNPYAIRIKAPYEDPRQAFTLITEDRGIDVVRPINLK